MPVLKRNAYFAHSENMLLAQVASETFEERLAAVEKIRALRLEAMDQDPDEIRIFKSPTVPAAAKTLDDPWEANNCKQQPPLLRDTAVHSLMKLVEAGPIQWEYPCQSQAVERVVQLVSITSTGVVGEHRRDGVIRTTISSREIMPAFKSKKDFKQ